MSSKIWQLGILISGLVLMGLATLNGQVLILALPLLIYLGAGVYFAPGRVTLDVVRQVGIEIANPGEPVKIQLAIENEGSPLDELYIEDRPPASLTYSSTKTKGAFVFRKGDTATIEYDVQGKRGEYRFPGVRVRASDYSGLFPVQGSIAAQGELVVVPEVSKLRRIPIRPQQTRGFSGPISIRRGGSGMDFYGVREYQLGDSIRHVNWRVSARQEEDLYTNQFEQERIADVGIILDARQDLDIVSKGERLFDFSIQAAASVSESFLKDGHRVGLFIYGHSLGRVFPGYGRAQQKAILAALARAETGKSYAMESLENIPTRLFPAHSQLVLVSPLGPSDVGALYRLRALGYEVLVVSPNPVVFEKGSLEPEPGIELAARLANIERTLFLRKLKQAGIQVIDWKVDQPLEGLITPGLVQPPAFRRNMQAIL